MARGGYRAPSNEKRAAVSNPRSGKRTDGMAGTKQAMREVPSNGQYGYRSDTAAATQGAPLAGSRSQGPSAAQVREASMANPIVPINAPTQNPGVPVTNGYMTGPGMTPEPEVPDRFAMIKAYKDVLDTKAAQDGQSEGFKLFWKSVLSQARNN
jgi:hypothetical protein